MADRRRDIILLLGSRYDGLYLPPGALTSRAGFVPADREPCQSCGGVLLRDDFGNEIRRQRGRGWILDRYRRRQPCPECGGPGWVARDPMDALGLRIGSETTSSTARPRRTVACDACSGDGVRASLRCARCDGTGRRDLHAFELHLDTRDEAERDPLLQAIEDRNRAGSYAELEHALADLRRGAGNTPRFAPLREHAAAALRLLDAVHLPPTTIAPADLNAAEQWLVDLALAYLDSRLPDPLRVPAEVRANARERREWARRAKGRSTSPQALAERNRNLVRDVRRGVPKQRVAFEYGLTVSAIDRVLRGEDP